MGDKKNSVRLEVDDTILKNKLLLSENSPEGFPDDFESLLPLLEGNLSSKGEVPWKWVQPTPGLCIKTHSADGQKVFINICHTTGIPDPQNLDEEMLLKMYASLEEDGSNMGIRIPLSIGDCHEELDKSGDPCSAYDVAVSSGFFERAQNSRVHLRFLTQVAIESVADKFKVEIDPDQYTVLKNRKTMGKLQRHRIEQRGTKMPLIQDLGSSSSSSSSAGPSKAGEPAASTPALAAAAAASASGGQTKTGEGRRSPERWRMVRRAPSDDADPELFIAEITMNDVVNATEVSFRAGEDRLVVESARRGYSWDVFVPVQLDADAARATFVCTDRVLNIQIPIVAG